MRLRERFNWKLRQKEGIFWVVTAESERIIKKSLRLRHGNYGLVNAYKDTHVGGSLRLGENGISGIDTPEELLG